VAISKLRDGVRLADGPARFKRIEPTGKTEGSNRWYRVILAEGRNREVRRMIEAVGSRVSRLIRIRFGSIALPRDLSPGGYLELDEARVRAMTEIA
jgi:23S rRNA pseudouridine2605 synthase